MRPHGHFRVDSRAPVARAVCDRCGGIYNRTDLNFQFQWAGAQLQNLQLLVCPRCMDVPQPQLRTIILPPDPLPIPNPRIEQTGLDNNPYSGLGINIGTMTFYGGLAGAFDSNTNKPLQFCATAFPSAVGYNNWVGKSWDLNGAQFVSSFTITAPNNSTFSTGGAISYKFQGSNNALVWTDLSSGVTAGVSNWESITTDITPSASYLYHRIVFNGDGIVTIYLAQLIIDVQGSSPE